MKKSNLFVTLAVIAGLLFTVASCQKQEASEGGSLTHKIDMVQAREIIKRNVAQFSEDFRDGDSLALAAHYAVDGSLGSIKGKDLVSAWGGMIRSAVKDGTPNMNFKTNSLASDGEFIVELGVYEFTDNENIVKNQGKYLVVWKQENGNWKMYRDIGL